MRVGSAHSVSDEVGANTGLALRVYRIGISPRAIVLTVTDHERRRDSPASQAPHTHAPKGCGVNGHTTGDETDALNAPLERQASRSFGMQGREPAGEIELIDARACRAEDHGSGLSTIVVTASAHSLQSVLFRDIIESHGTSSWWGRSKSDAPEVFMSEQAIPAIAEDGTHVFPITSLTAPVGDSYAGASGEIRWNPRDGLTFTFRVPSSSGLAGAPTVEGPTPWKQGAGFHEVPREPAWTGTVASGKSFRLFATKGVSRQELRTGTGGKSNTTVLIGQAVYGELVLPNDGPVSFFRATPRKPRYFISGFQPCPWPDFYEDRFNEGKSCRSVGCLTLQAAPLLRVMLGGECGVPDGAWLVDEGEVPPDIRTPPETCDEARRFISFLVGRTVPFLWSDRFMEEHHFTRLYFGSPHGFSTVLGNEQPLPLCHLCEVIKYSRDICAKLPAMFKKFR